jgi:outer membrane protein assembly factor BamB
MKEARISTVLRRGGKPRRTLACFLLSAATLLLGSHSSGQESLEAGGVHPPIDRQLSRGIARAAEGLAAGQYAQSLRFLDEALSRKDDYFVDVHQQGEFVGLKELARRMIRELPPEGREIYESTYGPTARRLLNAAVKSGDVAALQAIVERFFETSAGREAALLLAREQADSGKRLSAALLLDRLLDSPQARTELEPQLSFQAAAAFVATGQEQRARDVLAEAAQRGAAVEIAGEKLAVSNRAAAEDWIDHLTTDLQPNSAAGPREWVSARGGENDADGGGLPHRRVRWKVRLLTHPKLEEKLAEIAADQRSTGSAAPVAAAPLAVGNVVLVRTVDCMLAVDFTTGKRIWRSQPQREPQIELLIAPQGGAPGDVADLGPLRALSRRTWDDCLYAALSSDGQRVYVLRDLAMPAQATYEMWQGPLSVGGREASGVVNRLCAYDLATQGKLIWEIDGATEGPLQGAFFLGVPSAAGTTLYALAEIKNRIYLTALDGAAGSVEWMQQLVDVETGVNQNLQRRLQAQTPAYDSGMLVCTTGTGIVVGVDAAQHSLAWAYRYPSTPTATAVYEPTPEDGRTGQDRWLDAGVTLAAGKVLLTPPESQSIHCLDLRTGKLLWKAPRGAMRRLEGVEGDVALLSGPRSLRALKVADGSPAWPAELLLGRDESISGTGFFSAGRCYLPLSTGSVIAVDAASGSIAARVGSHDGEALGNLVCHRGAVLSSNGLTLDRFDQVESLKRAAERRLAKNPAHVPSLTTMGEIAFNEGRLSEAVDLLVRAYRLDPTDVDVGESLSECLTEALDQNFAAFRQHLGVLSELGRNDPATRVNLLRLQSQGQLAEGEWLDSAKAALELSHLIRNGDEPLVIGRSHQTTIARWVQSQLLAIRDRADAATWKTIDELVDSAAASTAESPAERLRDLVACFGDLPGREGLKLSWASRLQADGRAVEAQQLLLDLAESPSAAIRCEALGRLSLQLHEAGQHQLAAGFDRELAGPLADVATSAGEKGAALAVRFAAAQGAEPIVWPQGVVETSTQMLTRTDGMRMHAPLWGLRWERTDPTLAGLTAMISARGGELILIDSLGRELFNRPLEQQNMIHYRQPGSMYAAARGSLMVVSLGRQIAAVSTLPNAPDAGQALLWRADVAA